MKNLPSIPFQWIRYFFFLCVIAMTKNKSFTLLSGKYQREEGVRLKKESTGMGSEALHSVKIYRHLLKSVKKHIGQEDCKRHFRDFITEEFKKSRALSDPASIQNKLKLARDYAYLLNSVHHHKVLCPLFLIIYY